MAIWRMLCQKHVLTAGTSNYTLQKLWNIITCPCSWYMQHNNTQECSLCCLKGQGIHNTRVYPYLHIMKTCVKCSLNILYIFTCCRVASWRLLKGNHRSPVNSYNKGSFSRALLVYLLLPWTNGRTNDQVGSDLGRHGAHVTSLLL